MTTRRNHFKVVVQTAGPIGLKIGEYANNLYGLTGRERISSDISLANISYRMAGVHIDVSGYVGLLHPKILQQFEIGENQSVVKVRVGDILYCPQSELRPIPSIAIVIKGRNVIYSDGEKLVKTSIDNYIGFTRVLRNLKE